MLRLLLLLLSSLTLWADAHIFVYHRFNDPRHPSTNTSLKELEREFTYLKTHHYRVITLSKLVQALNDHEPIRDNWVVITIDDGFKSFLKALPLFKKFGYPFTIFISTKPTQKHYPDFLSWDDLKRVSRFGEVALHSHAHPHLVDLSDKAIRNDTQKGIELFYRHLGFKPRFYAYPYGEYDERVKKIIQSFGFKGIVNQNRGAIANWSDPNDLPRIALVGRSNLPRALRIQALKALWIEPQEYPKDGLLRHIEVQIDPHYKSAQLYVTGYGWKKVHTKRGRISEDVAYKLHKRRVRVIIKVKHSKISTKLLVRSEYGAE